MYSSKLSILNGMHVLLDKTLNRVQYSAIIFIKFSIGNQTI
jgi:hypothetical protein